MADGLQGDYKDLEHLYFVLFQKGQGVCVVLAGQFVWFLREVFLHLHHGE